MREVDSETQKPASPWKGPGDRRFGWRVFTGDGGWGQQKKRRWRLFEPERIPQNSEQLPSGSFIHLYRLALLSLHLPVSRTKRVNLEDWRPVGCSEHPNISLSLGRVKLPFGLNDLKRSNQRH